MIGLLRRELFDAAVLGVEMDADGESMIEYIARFPSAGLLMATGPGGDWELERCARFGNAVAAFCVQAIGTTTGIRSFDEIQKFQQERTA